MASETLKKKKEKKQACFLHYCIEYRTVLCCMQLSGRREERRARSNEAGETNADVHAKHNTLRK